MRSLRITTLCSTFLMLVATGCALSDEPLPQTGPEVDTAEGAVKVKLADVANRRLTLQYRLDGRNLTFEAVFSDEPQWDNPKEMVGDIRVLDHEGNVMAIEIGGHGTIDPTWSGVTQKAGNVKQVALAAQMVSEEVRVRDLAVAETGAPKIRSLVVPPELVKMRDRVARFAQAVSEPEWDAKDILEGEPAVTPKSYEWYNPSGVVKWDYVVREKPAFFDWDWDGWFDHSAIYGRGWSSSSSIVFKVWTSNHGTSASDTSVMETTCVMAGFSYGSHPGTRYIQWCDGSYAFPHVCNNDTQLQGENIYYDNGSPYDTSNSAWPCNYAKLYAPSCH